MRDEYFYEMRGRRMIVTVHGQVALRNIRRNAIEAVKKLEKGTTPISEDESKSMQVRVTVPGPSPPHSCRLALAPLAPFNFAICRFSSAPAAAEAGSKQAQGHCAREN
jgi:hypothetical protein